MGAENGNEELGCVKNTKLLFADCVFAEEEVGLFRKVEEHLLFGFELDGRLDNTGNGSVT